MKNHRTPKWRACTERIEVTLTEAFRSPTGAWPIGDIGLRDSGTGAAAQHWRSITEPTSFVSHPSYTPRWFPGCRGSSTPYGVDYIDPWVYQLTEHEPMFSRAWWTRKAALILEPRAIRKAALISGVAEEYFLPALRRNFTLEETPVTVSFPYGFDPEDHKKEPINSVYPFDPQVVGGEQAHLPTVSLARQLPLSHPFKRKMARRLKLQFVGTGRRPGPSIADLAEEWTLATSWRYPERIPFLSVQSL